MLIMACFPWVELILFGSISVLKRILDSGWYFGRTEDSEMKTKAKTQRQYINLYAGPEYLMHFKYSSILVQVFVSFMYGMFIPFLFITTLLGIFNMYCVERLALAYYYRQPPLYDASINSMAIRILKAAPILMFLIGYWGLGNRQVFFNEPFIEMDHANSTPNPNHLALSFKHGWNHTHLCLLMFILLVIEALFSNKMWPCFKKILYYDEKKMLNTDDVTENLDEYWKNIIGKE
jgi:hypothetical protein